MPPGKQTAGCRLRPKPGDASMWIAVPLANALIAVLLLAGLPFLGYFIWHKWRHKRTFAEIARRAGLQGSDTRYVLISAAVAALVVCALLLWQPPMAPFTRIAFSKFGFVRIFEIVTCSLTRSTMRRPARWARA